MGHSISNSKSKLEQLKQAEVQVQEQVQKGKISEEQYRAFQREIVKAEQELSKLETKAKDNNKVFVDLGDKINNAMKTATLAVTGTAVAFGTVAIKSASEYEQSLKKVSTIADTTKMSLEQISKEVKQTSDVTGVSATEINEALYQAISAGADTANAMELVNVAVKSAKGGFTDTSTAVDGLTTVLNSYNLSTTDAEKIANQFLVTQNKGKTTFGELASSIGKVAPTAKAANIQTDELLSSIASLTANGIGTSEAVTGMKAALSNIIKPSNQASAMAEQLGLDFSATALKTKGLNGFLLDLKDKTGGNVETMAQLFGSTEALNTVLTLVSDDGMSLMNETMSEMSTNTNAVEESFEKVTSGSTEKWTVLTNEVKNLSISVGEMLLPLMDNVLNLLKWFIDNGEIVITIIAGIAAGLLAWNVVVMVQKLYSSIEKWKVATEGMTIAQKALNIVMNANPMAIVISLVTGLIAVITTLWFTNEDFRNALIEIWENIKKLFSDFSIWFKDCFTSIKTFFINLWDAIHYSIKNTWGQISFYMLEKVNYITNVITSKFGFMWDSLQLGFSAFKKLFKGDFKGFFDDIWSMITTWSDGWNDLGKNMLKNLWNGILSLKDWLFDKVHGFFSGIMSSVKGLFSFDDTKSSSSSSKARTSSINANELSTQLAKMQRNLQPISNNTNKTVTNLTQNISFNGDYKARQGQYIVNDINRQLGLLYK